MLLSRAIPLYGNSREKQNDRAAGISKQNDCSLPLVKQGSFVGLIFSLRIINPALHQAQAWRGRVLLRNPQQGKRSKTSAWPAQYSNEHRLLRKTGFGLTIARVFDSTALKAIQDELNEKILHGHVQEIVQTDELAFGFEIYAQHTRHNLYLSAHPNDARAHLVSHKMRGNGQTPSPLLLLLRKQVENAFIDSIIQLPHERVLKIQFDHSAEGLSTLVIETIGKYSNIILVDPGGTVIDALKRVGSQVNRTRVILPKQPYVPPPPQSKFSPATLTTTDLASVFLENRGAPVWQVLVKSTAGVSPLLAREIVFRVQGKTNALCDPARSEELVKSLEKLTRAPWQPSVAFEDGEPAAFAPYTLTQFADIRPFDSISVAIETFFGIPESYVAVKEPLHLQIAEARDRLARKRDALAQSLPSVGEIDRLRTSGELILAYASQIKAGQNTLSAETETGIVEIPLDPKRSPVDNAQEYFREYRRLQHAAARVPALLAVANADLEYAEQMINDLELAENRAEIDTVIVTAREAGLLQSTQQKARVKPSEPRVVTSRDGFAILVGKNARQNEEITFRRAKPDDIWLHARKVAGAHVVILQAGQEIPESTIEQAAVLAAQSSQARDDSRVDVIVTARRNVHRVRGGRMGMVTVRGERVVTVVPTGRAS